jgi:hypothetical protein
MEVTALEVTFNEDTATRNRKAVRSPGLLLGLALLGYAVHFATPISLCLTILAACLLAARPDSRVEAFSLATTYYVFALESMPAAIRGFYQGHSDAMLLLYPCAIFLLSLPWVLLWGRTARNLRCIAAVLITAIPPLGLIGWYSPLSAAGWLFPCWGFLGIAALLVVLMCGTLAVNKPKYLIPFGLLAVSSSLLNIAYPHKVRGTARAPFAGVDLRRSPLLRESPEYQRQIRAAIYAYPQVPVIVLPEATFPVASPFTDLFFQDEFNSLTRSGQVLIAGGVMPGPGERYRSGFLLRGAQVGFFDERVPVPVAMWKPFTDSGAALRLLAPSTVDVQGVKTAVLVCYEMVIPWTAITALNEHPQELVGIANDDWTAGDPTIPTLQRTSLNGWARLAGIKSVFAANLPLEEKR